MDLDGKALPKLAAAVVALMGLVRAVVLACLVARSWCVRVVKYLVRKAKPYV